MKTNIIFLLSLTLLCGYIPARAQRTQAQAEDNREARAPRKEAAAQDNRETKTPARDGLKVRFLGTGAADWKGPDARGEHRRLTSILLDDRIFIDFTESDADMLPGSFRAAKDNGALPGSNGSSKANQIQKLSQGTKCDAIFYTHSHGDHFDAAAELRHIGARKVFVGETWVDRAREEFAKAAAAMQPEEAQAAAAIQPAAQPAAGNQALTNSKILLPEIIPLKIGDKVTIGDITITALPANHSTGDDSEQTLIFLVEKADVRLLYATDTGGILSRAARIVGIDAHVKGGTPITALIMEATMGMGHDEDFRIFAHSSAELVKRTADVLISTGRLKAPAGQPVYLTHLARTLHGTQAELDATLPEPLKAAYDGLEVVFRAPAAQEAPAAPGTISGKPQTQSTTHCNKNHPI